MKRKGFTLIELLVVIAIIGILATFLIPAVLGALQDANITKMQANGKSIYTSVFREVSQGRDNWPDEPTYSTSVEWFEYLVDPTNATMEVSFDFFGGPGLKLAKSIDPNDFDEDNCAWSFVDSVGLKKDTVPLLVSRNYTAATIAATTGGSGSDFSSSVGETGNVGLVFNEDEVLVVRKGGAAERITEPDFKDSANLNPTDDTLDVVHP